MITESLLSLARTAGIAPVNSTARMYAEFLALRGAQILAPEVRQFLIQAAQQERIRPRSGSSIGNVDDIIFLVTSDHRVIFNQPQFTFGIPNWIGLIRRAIELIVEAYLFIYISVITFFQHIADFIKRVAAQFSNKNTESLTFSFIDASGLSE